MGRFFHNNEIRLTRYCYVDSDIPTDDVCGCLLNAYSPSRTVRVPPRGCCLRHLEPPVDTHTAYIAVALRTTARRSGRPVRIELFLTGILTAAPRAVTAIVTTV